MKELQYSLNNKWIDKMMTRSHPRYSFWMDVLGIDPLAYKKEKGKGPTVLGTTDGEYYAPIKPARRWVNVHTSIEQMFHYIINKGFSISFQFLDYNKKLVYNKASAYRKQDNFVQTNVIMVDVDNGVTIEQALNTPFYKLCGSGFYTTASHTEQSPRYRLVFTTERMIQKVSDLRPIYHYLIELFGADPSCSDGARMFYGSKGGRYEIVKNKQIPNNILDEIIISTEKKEKRRENRKPPRIIKPPLLEERIYLVELLKNHYLGDYDKWLPVCGAMKYSGYTLEDFTSATIGGMMDQKDETDCQVLWDGLPDKEEQDARLAQGKIDGIQTIGSVFYMLGVSPLTAQNKKVMKTKKDIAELKQQLNALQ